MCFWFIKPRLNDSNRATVILNPRLISGRLKLWDVSELYRDEKQ